MIQISLQGLSAIHLALRVIFKKGLFIMQIHNADTFSEWLQVYLHEQLVYSDGLAAALVYDALEQDDLETVWKFDRLLTVQNLARETREGTQRIGERLLKITETLYEDFV